jgi:hypothetical protein
MSQVFSMNFRVDGLDETQEWLKNLPKKQVRQAGITALKAGGAVLVPILQAAAPRLSGRTAENVGAHLSRTSREVHIITMKVGLNPQKFLHEQAFAAGIHGRLKSNNSMYYSGGLVFYPGIVIAGHQIGKRPNLSRRQRRRGMDTRAAVPPRDWIAPTAEAAASTVGKTIIDTWDKGIAKIKDRTS